MSNITEDQQVSMGVYIDKIKPKKNALSKAQNLFMLKLLPTTISQKISMGENKVKYNNLDFRKSESYRKIINMQHDEPSLPDISSIWKKDKIGKILRRLDKEIENYNIKLIFLRLLIFML